MSGTCMLQEHHYCHVQLRGKFLFCIQLIWFSKTLTMLIYDCVFIHECKINFVFLGIRRLTEQDTPPNFNNLMTNNNPTHCTCIYKVLTVYFMSLKSKYYQICHIATSTYWVRRRIKGDHGSVSDAPAVPVLQARACLQLQNIACLLLASVSSGEPHFKAG